MSFVNDIIARLAETRHLPSRDYAVLLSPSLDPKAAALLTATARERADGIFGRKVRIRGLIEVTNVCRNNCLYCGLRRDNHTLPRYTLSADTILDSCRNGYEAGFRTFVLQGGENPALTVERVTETVRRIYTTYPDTAITLSLGEWPDEAYAAFRQAGASAAPRDTQPPALQSAPPVRHESRQPSEMS